MSTRRISHSHWAQVKEWEEGEKKLERRRSSQISLHETQLRTQTASEKFDKWLQEKETYQRAEQLLSQISRDRCRDEDLCAQVAVALCAVDLGRGIHKQEPYQHLPLDRDVSHNASKADMKKRKTLEQLFYKWCKDPQEGKEFMDVEVPHEHARTFTGGAQSMMSEYAEEAMQRKGDFIRASLRFTVPKVKQAAGDKRNLYNPDTVKFNAIYNKLLREDHRKAQLETYERIDKMVEDVRAKRVKAGARQKDLDLAELQRQVIYRMGLATMAKWVEDDAREAEDSQRRKMKEDRETAELMHRKFIKKKERMRVRIPEQLVTKTRDIENANSNNGTAGSKSAIPRMDFTLGRKGRVQRLHKGPASTSVEIAVNAGAVTSQYVYCQSQRDLRASRKLLSDKGFVLKDNFVDEDGDALDDEYRHAKRTNMKHKVKRDKVKDREKKSKEVFEEWLQRKALIEAARNSLMLVDFPGTQGDSSAVEAHWRSVAGALKAVDPSLFGDFVSWTRGFKSLAHCRVVWDALSPSACDTCTPSSAVHKTLIRVLNRPGLNFNELLDVAVDRAVARAMVSDGRRSGEETEEERTEIADQLELSPKQFAAVMESGGVPLTASETRVLVTMFDRDANGKISRDEFLIFTGYDKRPKTRGDVSALLRAGKLCAWEACDHVTGMANAFQVQPDSDNLLAAASSSAAGLRRASREQKQRRKKSIRQEDEDDGGYDDGFDGDGDDDEEEQGGYSEDDEFKADEGNTGIVNHAAIIAACRPVLTRNGSEKAGWIRYPLPDLIKRQRTLLSQGLRIPEDLDKVPPSSCQQTLWTNTQRAEAVKQLRLLARSNKELQDTMTRVTTGNPPAPPQLFSGSAVALLSQDEEEDNYDDDEFQEGPSSATAAAAPADDLNRETTLVIRWGPGVITQEAFQDATMPSFFILETAGRHGSRSHRQHEYRQVARDPPNASFADEHASGHALCHVISNLEPSTRYYFRIRAFNGYGPSKFTYASFATAPAPPPRPIVIRATPNSVRLDWSAEISGKNQLEALKQIFQDLSPGRTDESCASIVDVAELMQVLSRQADLWKFLACVPYAKLISGEFVPFLEYISLCDADNNGGGGGTKLPWADLFSLHSSAVARFQRATTAGTGSDGKASAVTHTGGERTTQYRVCVCVGDEDVDASREGFVSSNLPDDSAVLTLVDGVLRQSDWFTERTCAIPALSNNNNSTRGRSRSGSGNGNGTDMMTLPRLTMIEAPELMDGAVDKPSLRVILTSNMNSISSSSGSNSKCDRTEIVGTISESIQHLEVYKVVYIGAETKCLLTGLSPGRSYQFRVQAINAGPTITAATATAGSLASSQEQVSSSLSSFGNNSTLSRLGPSRFVHVPLPQPSPPKPLAVSAGSGRMKQQVGVDTVSLEWTSPPSVEQLMQRLSSEPGSGGNKTRPSPFSEAARGGRSANWTSVVADWAREPDAEETGGVSSASVNKMFVKYDRNGDGCIDARELQSLFRDLGIPTSGSAFHHARQQLDTNGDGKIVFREFADWWRSAGVITKVYRDSGVSAVIDAVVSELALKPGSVRANKHAKDLGMSIADVNAAVAIKSSTSPVSRQGLVLVYAGSETSVSISNLHPNTAYNFYIQHSWHKTQSPLSNALAVVTCPEVPQQPVVIEAAGTAMRVKWYPGQGGACKYVLQVLLVERMDLVLLGTGSGVHMASRGKVTTPPPSVALRESLNSSQRIRAASAMTRKSTSAKSGGLVPGKWTDWHTTRSTYCVIDGLIPNAMYRLRVRALGSDTDVSGDESSSGLGLGVRGSGQRQMTQHMSATPQSISDPSLPTQCPTTDRSVMLGTIASKDNATTLFEVECTGDVVVGDTILFSETIFCDADGFNKSRQFVATSRSQFRHSRPGTARSFTSVSSKSSDYSNGGGNGSSRRRDSRQDLGTSRRSGTLLGTSIGGGTREQQFLTERTIAAVVLNTRSGGTDKSSTLGGSGSRRVLALKVLWSTVSNKAGAREHIVTPGSLITRDEAEVFKFETFRARWLQENGRWSAAEEVECED